MESYEKPKKVNPRNTGKRHSAATKEKMRQAKLGKPRDDATKAKLRQANLGKKHGTYSPEHRAAISAAKKGKPPSTAMLAALEKAVEANRGRIPWNKGKKLAPLSEEHRRKIGAASKGRSVSAEMRASVSKAQKGRKRSDAEKAIHVQALQQYWARDDAKRYRSKIEMQVGWLLEPFGFVPQFRLKGYRHPYDYGHAERQIVIEVNGCYWHSHGCGIKTAGGDTPAKDAAHADYAVSRGFRVIILWQCQHALWPKLLLQEGVVA